MAENALPDSSSPPHFIKPVKEIKRLPDIEAWTKSKAYADYMGFLLTLNEAVKGKKLTDDCDVSETCEKLVAMLEELNKWVDETPPVDQPHRFGNMAYRTWHKRLEENAVGLIQKVLPETCKEAAVELEPYLTDGFGNYTRIDYGTGHEMAYAAFLCCLFKLRVLQESDSVTVVNRVFQRYLELTRRLQSTYNMEPAGSQGVWGLDDFQFLPFIWGSAQLFDHPTIAPKNFPDCKVAAENEKDYMFMGCIQFINSMKTGPFAEHSNVLWGISGVPHWQKVNQGLIKMYKAEHLSKFPIMQHFPFGSIMSFAPAR